MKVPVGPVSYRVVMLNEALLHEGQACFGLCDPQRQQITIDRRCKPERRISVFWHELAHAWKFELDVRGTEVMDTESLCNLIGMAMAAMDPYLVARLHAFLTYGIEPDLMMVCPHTRKFIPVVRLEGAIAV